MADLPLPPTPSEGGRYDFDPETFVYTRINEFASPISEEPAAPIADDLPISEEPSQ